MATQLPGGWTRESLRKAIIQRSKERKISPDLVFRTLTALQRISDERLEEIVRQVARELGIEH